MTDDIVWESEDFYKALTIHSSGVFATDLSNAEWVRMSDDIDKIGASTDNAVVRWDGVDGSAVQDSNVVISDTDDVTGILSLTVGAGALDGSSILDSFSTTKGTRPWPSMTTAQRDAIVAPVSGLTVYNTDSNKVNVFDGTTWGAVGSGLDAWQATFEYKQGDAIYDNTDPSNPIYRANADFTSGAVFVPGNWTELAQHINQLPAGSATANALLKWENTDGDDVLNTGIIVDASDNMTGVGDITMSNILVFRDALFNFLSDDVDGADASTAVFSAGGGLSNIRGSSISLNGNEVPAIGGSLTFELGAVGTADFRINDSSGDLSFNLDTLGVVSLPLLTPSKPLFLNASNEVVAGDISALDIVGALPVTSGGTSSTAALTNNLVMVSSGGAIVESAGLAYDGNLFEVSTPDGSIPMTKMNQASRLALTPVNGTTVYDTDDEIPYFYDGTSWKPIGALTLSSTDLASDSYTEASVPHDQITVTDVSNGIARVETGNDSFLSNGSFEHETFDTGWVTSGTGTFTVELTDVWEGNKAVSITTTGGAQDFELIQTKTKPQYEGNTLGFTCMVKSDSEKVKLCTENGTEERDCATHNGNGLWQKMQAIMLVDSTGVMTGSIKNLDSENVSVAVDSCEWSNSPLKIKNSVVDTEWVDYVPTTQGVGTPTIEFARWRRVGENIEINVKFVTGTVTATEIQVGLPTGLEIASNVGSNRYAGHWQQEGLASSWYSVIYTAGDTFLNAGHRSGGVSGIFTPQNGSTILASSRTQAFNISVPIEGWRNSKEEVLTSSDTVSSSSIPWNFKTSALDGSEAVGTYHTYSKAASSNAFTSCGATTPSTPPTNLDGFFMRGRAFTQAGDCVSNVSRFEVKLPTGLKGFEYTAYENPAKAGKTLATADYSTNSASGYGVTKWYDEATGILTIDTGRSTNSAETSRSFKTRDSADSAFGYFHFHASKNPVVNAIELDAISERDTCYIKDVKAAGVDGGTFTSGAWQTRTLNTLEGDCDGISLALDQVTITGTGSWRIKGLAPAYAVGRHKAKVFQVGGSDLIFGSSEWAHDTNNTQSSSHIVGGLTVSGSLVFEIQHQGSTTEATFGFGNASNFGVIEVYTQLELTRIK